MVPGYKTFDKRRDGKTQVIWAWKESRVPCRQGLHFGQATES